MLSWTRSFASARTAPPAAVSSHIKAKLDHFITTGEVQRLSPVQQHRKQQRHQETVRKWAARSKLLPSKALLMLKAKYDSTLLSSETGQKINLDKLKPHDLKVDSPRLAQIFQALMEVKKLARKPIDDKLVLTLLGSSPEQIKDPYVVTHDVLKLLERDENAVRAAHLCLLARENGVVGMNAVLQWHLDRGKVEEAQRSLSQRKKWGIPANTHTYIHYFGGLARCHEWGQVPGDLAQKCVEQFAKMDVKPTIEMFNACMSLLVKDYTNSQERAWDFFDQLELLHLPPTSQTFTIFLNGCKHFHHSECLRIRADRSLSATQRSQQLFAAQAQLVETANMVFEKVKKAATPPVPPTKEEATADPGLLDEYRKKIRVTLMDIDRVFAATFVLCFINNSAGTSYTASQGSHYAYLQQGLTYLQMWCPEVDSMLKFALNPLETTSELGSAMDFASAVSPDVRKRTDSRVEEARLSSDLIPFTHCRPLDKRNVNPLVSFPPPAFSSNKTRAVFSGKQKPLVDFGRPTFANIAKMVAHRNYVNSKGKYGKKLSALQSVSLDRTPAINKFLLQLALDSLIKLGLHKEFYLAMWYALTRWGGLYVSRDNLLEAEKEKLTCAALPQSAYPEMVGPQRSEKLEKTRAEKPETPEKSEQLKKSEELEKSEETEKSETPEPSLSEKKRLTPPHDPSIIDAMLVENFIYKMEENFFHSKVPARYATELVAAMVSPSSNMSKTLVPRDKTFDYIFSVLNRDLHLYNDKNVHQGAAANRRRQLADNTPKRSLTAQQLKDILEPLLALMQTIMVHEAEVFSKVRERKSLMLNRFVESYSSLIKSLLSTTWSDAPDNHDAALEMHKKIVHSGILFYRPKSLIDPREKISYAEPVITSLEFVYKQLKAKSDLGSSEKKLMLTLRSLFQLDPANPQALEILQSLKWKIYRLSA